MLRNSYLFLDCFWERSIGQSQVDSDIGRSTCRRWRWQSVLANCPRNPHSTSFWKLGIRQPWYLDLPGSTAANGHSSTKCSRCRIIQSRGRVFVPHFGFGMNNSFLFGPHFPNIWVFNLTWLFNINTNAFAMDKNKHYFWPLGIQTMIIGPSLDFICIPAYFWSGVQKYQGSLCLFRFRRPQRLKYLLRVRQWLIRVQRPLEAERENNPSVIKPNLLQWLTGDLGSNFYEFLPERKWTYFYKYQAVFAYSGLLVFIPD